MTISDDDSLKLRVEANKVFNPSAPVDSKALFAGRLDQISQLLDAISQRGRHAIIYGERGVGKTSLANILKPLLEGIGEQVVALRVNCDGSDTFSSVWRKAFSEIVVSRTRRVAGFLESDTTESVGVLEELPETLTPDTVRRVLADAGGTSLLIVIVDEFDRVRGDGPRKLFPDTLKALSDHSVRATVVLVGVAADVDELIEEHQSVERALVQIHLPRMDLAELREIIDRGLGQLGMTMEADAREHVCLLSQGLPYYTHMLALYSTRQAIAGHSLAISTRDVETGIREAIKVAHHSIRRDYHQAVSSPQRGNLYKEVLLACALTKTDELGYFTAADVRGPVRRLTKKSYDIPNFAQHLNAFCEDERGRVLEKTGRKHRFQFRFRNPLMQPFVTLQGYADGMIKLGLLESE